MITPRLNKMLRYIVILFALTPCCWSAVSQASKCDHKIISKIKEKYWNRGFCIPKDIIRTGIFWEKWTIVMTITGHYSDEEHISCASVKFSNSSVDLFVKYDKSSNLLDHEEKFDITENEGVLIDKGRGEQRYYLTSGIRGVRCVYKCSDAGKTGAPDGLIEVSEHGYDEEALEQCIKDLESLGIIMSTTKISNRCEA